MVAGRYRCIKSNSTREWYDLTNKPLNEQEIYVFVDGLEFFDWHYDAIENRVYFDVIPDEESLVEIAYYY